MRLALVFALTKLALHIAINVWEAHLGWGYCRDEFYYILCGQHLDWGYVDHGPIVALQARLAIFLFGKSLAGIRLLSALAGAVMIFETGWLAWEMGARRAGQALAMTGLLLAPQFLGTDSVLSMNSFEPVFWMGCVLAILRILQDGSPQWWIVFGIAAGLGMENKPSMLVFLMALLLGLLVTPERSIFRSRWMLLGVALAALLEMPNVLWQLHYHWPTLEFLHNGRAEHKNVELAPLAFLHAQELMLSPVSLPLWGAGLVWLFRAKAGRFRFYGFTYVLFLAMMMATGDAKDYYLAPVYPMLFAAGGCAWEGLLASRRWRWAVPVYASLLVVLGILVLPMALPVFSPQQWLNYADKLHLRDKASHQENTEDGPLPQFYADRFGWQEETDAVARIYNSLAPEEKARAGILCNNYGEASAINFLGAGRGLPFAISGHNNYYLWGPHGETGSLMIVINGATPEEMRENYNSVEVVGWLDHPYAMPYEHKRIYLCRDRKWSLIAGWSELKHYL